MTKKKKIFVLCVVFVVGIILGVSGTSYFLFNIYSHSIIEENKINTRHRIIIPYVILTHLRKNNTAMVIEMQEDKLDSGLYSLVYEKKQAWGNDKETDEQDRLMLKKVRAYRTKYPRKSKIPEFEKQINDLLFPK